MLQRTAGSLALGIALAAIMVCGTVWAAETAPRLGVVDMDRIAVEYRAMQDLNQQFQQFQRSQDEALEARYKTRVLDDDERQEYLDLADMGAPTAERDKRLSELADLSDTRERRLLELRQKEERSPFEEDEYDQLRVLYDMRMQELAAVQADLQQTRRAKQEELTKVVTDSVDGAVKAVAEEQQLSTVVRKEMVLYGGLDITEDVLAKLNAEAPAELEGAEEPAELEGAEEPAELEEAGESAAEQP